MWAWDFEYANGKTSNVLVVPVGKPVKLNLFSPDVIHSLYIPAFRVKEDVTPGVKNYMWFQSDKLGEYDIFCAEYCGVRHSYMLSKVRVVSEEAYLQWFADVQKVEETAKPIGLQVMEKNGCFACHSSDGSKLVGPSFKGLAGERTIVTADGEKQQVADDEYIKRAIYEPNTDVVKGFNKGLMISYKDKITDAEMTEVIKYLKQLNEK